MARKLKQTLSGMLVIALSFVLANCTRGQVFDESGQPVADADVTLINQDSGKTWYATTDASGYFTLNGYDDNADYVTPGMTEVIVVYGIVGASGESVPHCFTKTIDHKFDKSYTDQDDNTYIYADYKFRMNEFEFCGIGPV